MPHEALKKQYMDWLRYQGCSPLTLYGYANELKKLFEHFGATNVMFIGTMELQLFLTKAQKEGNRGKGLKPRSMHRLIGCLRSFFDWGRNFGYCTSNVARTIVAPKLQKTLPNFLTQDETMKYITSLSHPRDQAMAEAIYGSGLRISEACSLNVSDVGPDSTVVRIFGKGGKERIVPFGSYARQALLRYLVWRRQKLGKLGKEGEAALFVSKNGTRITQRAVRRIFVDHGVTAGFSKKTKPHTLRHSFATHLIQRGGRVEKLQKMLGHSNLRTTMGYVDVADNDVMDDYEKHHPRA